MKRMFRWWAPVVMGLGIGLGTMGCSTQEPSEPAAPVPAQVQFSDRDLRGDLGIGRVKMWRDSSQLLHVDVPVENCTASDLPIDWRVTYFDANGIPLGEPTGWAAVTLSPNVYQDIGSNCSTARGNDFRMDLRYAR